jgi:trigger factor
MRLLRFARNDRKERTVNEAHGHSHNLTVKKVDRLSPTKVRLTVEFSSDDVRDHESQIANKYSRSARIPGFRPGKAPLKMIRERYKDEIKRDLVSHLLEAGLHKAVEQTKLWPVNQPSVKVQEISEGKPFSFDVEYEVSPEIELKKYKDIPLKREKFTADEKEVEKTIEGLRDRMATMEPSDAQTPAKGNFAVVEVSFEAKDGSHKEEVKSYTVEVGMDKLLPAIDKALLEMKVGEERKVEEAFPPEYSDKKMAGKEALFSVKLIEVKKKVLPPLDDAFASQLREGWKLDQLKEDVRKNILQSKEEENQSKERQQIIDYLVNNNSFEVPTSMIDEQASHLVQSVQEDIKRRGMNPPPLKPEEMKSVRERAERMVRSSLLLKEVAVKEKIVLDDQRVSARVDAIAGQLGRSVDETQKLLTGRNMMQRIRDEILTDQVFEFLAGNAKVS